MSVTNISKTITPYLQLIRFDRPIGTLLLLWPTLWGLWIAAEGVPPFKYLLIFGLGVFLMRSAGCVVNDIADKDFDGKVTRTKERPLAVNDLPVKNALVFFLILLLMAASLLFFLNKLTLIIAIIAAFFAITYPFMKRHTYLPQLYLGVSFALSIPMAFAQLRGDVPVEAWLLFIANIFWTTAYDTMYAMVDRKDDIKAGIKSTAILFGDLDYIIIAIIQVMMIVVLSLLGLKLEMHSAYYIGLVLIILLFLYQNQLLRTRNISNYFKAFLNNNWVGLVLFCGIFISYFSK
jgi:4-hydroxybenzoate polyprenyltransferase